METWWLWWWYSHYYTGYGYYCLLLNDIPHVWHRLVANLEMNSYNQFGYQIVKMYSSTLDFYAKCCQASSTYKALHSPWCHFISGLWRVSLAEYIRVLRVYPTILQVKFSACWRWWLTTGGPSDYIYSSSICFCLRMSLMLAMYLELILM